MATCFDSIESSSGLPKKGSNVSTFIVHSGIPNANAFGIPECTINSDTLDLFKFRGCKSVHHHTFK